MTTSESITVADYVQCGDAAAMANMLLELLDQKPVLHRFRRVNVEPFGPYPWSYGKFTGFSDPIEGIEDEYFYAAPVINFSVPDGWKLVPIDPTEEMLASAKEWFGLTATAEGVYEKMIAAAPAAPEQQIAQQNIPENILEVR